MKYQHFQNNNAILATLPEHTEHAFVNPFCLEDVLVFEHEHLCQVLADGLRPEHLAWSLHGAPPELIQRCLNCQPVTDRASFLQAFACQVKEDCTEMARHLLLDKLFWELTYWKTPELYEELTVGERLHPGIFQQLEPRLAGKIVLDVGAGSGRASFEAVAHGASLVYAVEPSPGLRRLLQEKMTSSCTSHSLLPMAGDFAHLPLPDQSVDLAISCSAFTSEETLGGEAGLAEFKRVTRPGGLIVIIWPRLQDHCWLTQHGFSYVALPQKQEMTITFSSPQSALRCARRFYAHNQRALSYLLQTHEAQLPFSVLGVNAPCDYFWLAV